MEVSAPDFAVFRSQLLPVMRHCKGFQELPLQLLRLCSGHQPALGGLCAEGVRDQVVASSGAAVSTLIDQLYLKSVPHQNSDPTILLIV